MFLNILDKSMTSTFTKTVVSCFCFFRWLLSNFATEVDEGNFSCGLCHSASGSDQGARETCQPGWSTPSGARQVGEARVLMEPLCLSLHPCLSSLLYLFHSFSLSHKRHCDRIESLQLVEANKFIMEMAGERVETTGQSRKLECSVPFSICLCVYLSIWSIYFSIVQPPARGVWGIRHTSVVCVQVCVCV